eukprot:UN01779
MVMGKFGVEIIENGCLNRSVDSSSFILYGWGLYCFEIAYVMGTFK